MCCVSWGSGGGLSALGTARFWDGSVRGRGMAGDEPGWGVQLAA